jgi:serine O-acetyltransferase
MIDEITGESHAGISADVPDWSREKKAFLCWDPSRSLLASIRAYQRYADSKDLFRRIGRNFAVLRHRFWSAVTAADIPINCTIGGGLMIPHPVGVVIHPNAYIGPNCLIFQQVTIGTRKGNNAPHIGGHVDIGAGAKILGSVRVGNHARIGANAVVLREVPEGRTAVGIPSVLVGDPK